METRCAWCTSDPLYLRYHDKEWGVPVHDERRLFEMLILEGAQAGLSWLTILKRREGYRAAFDCFDAKKIARYDAKKIAALMENPGIIRNHLRKLKCLRRFHPPHRLRNSPSRQLQPCRPPPQRIRPKRNCRKTRPNCCD